MEKILTQFEVIATEPLKYARQWKEKTQGKVVGCMGLYVPEEIVHAAGMLPIVIFEKDEHILKAQKHVQNVMCGYIRSVVDQSLLGDFDFLDCLVAHDACHEMRMLLDVMKRNSKGLKRLEPLFFPVTLKKPHSWSYLIKELYSFISRMEEISGESISEEKLKNSIRLYNRHRQLLKEVYRLRRQKPGLLSAVQVSNIVKSSMSMPKEEHNILLEKLIKDLDVIEVKKTDKVPLVVSGSLCETCDSYVLEAIEEAGGIIVDDDLYVGSRYFVSEVDEDAPPIESLAYTYINMVSPCPTRYDPNNDLSDYLANMVKKSGAKGIVNIMVEYCEAHAYSYFKLHTKMKEKKIPEYIIKTEHEVKQKEQVKTRVQSFIENIDEWRSNL